jgi:hypothetical protein
MMGFQRMKCVTEMNPDYSSLIFVDYFISVYGMKNMNLFFLQKY